MWLCERPLWRGDDFSQCARESLLQIVFPSIIAGVSMLWLAYWAVHRIAAARRARMYQPLPMHHSAHGGAADGEDTDGDDEFAEHLGLRHTISRAMVNEVKVDRPYAERLSVILEELAILGIITTYCVGAVKVSQESLHGVWGWLAGALPWVYALVLTTVRFLYTTSEEYDLPALWNHTALFYMFSFLFSAVLFRSIIIHPPSSLAQALVITQFSLTALLGTLAVSVRRGNKPVAQGITDGLEPSREPLASLFSLATFSWVDGIVWKGFWEPFVVDGIWNLRNDDLAANVLTAFRQTKKTASLSLTLLSHFKRDLIIQALWAAFASLFTFAPTLLLRVILQYVQSPESIPKNVAWLVVALLFVTACISAVGDGQALFIGRRICIRLRAVIIGEVYSKALRRKAAAGPENALGEKPKKTSSRRDDEENGQANVGAIINLMAVDSFKVAEVCAYLHFLVAAVPIQVIIAVALLYQILGWSSIAGIFVMILLIPVNYVISSKFSDIQKQIMTTTDKRIHTTNEVLQNIRIIKYFAWEERFAGVVNESRTVELKRLRKRYVLWALAATSWYGSPILITFLSFLCYTVVEKKDLDAPIAFTALSLFNVLRVPLDQLADMVTNVLQTKVSVDRVEEYLNEEETEKYQQLRRHGDDRNAPYIGFKKATFTWGSKGQARTESNSAFQLRDLNIEFVPGQLNVIVGPTGSGKTSLLMALLGEMTHLEGSVYLPGLHSREDLLPHSETGLTESVAYCAQQPWLVNDTIKNNIVFASRYDPGRYQAVLIACSLERDLQILDHGDETEVGEKGISLSGGQKQRISLARALYSTSAHLLLDDCLSAVDAHTAKWIYDYCIMGPLMQGRTCILVTHNMALCVPKCRNVVVLDNGRITTQGSPDIVVATGALGNDEVLRASIIKSRSRPASRMPSRVPSYIGEPLGDTQKGFPEPNSISNRSAKVVRVKKVKISTEETKTAGGIDWKVYRLYLQNMGPWWYWVVVMGIFVAQQVGSVSTSVWIRQWAAKYQDVAQPSPILIINNVPSTSSGLGGSCISSGSCFWYFFSVSPREPGLFINAPKSDINVLYYLIVYALLGVVYTLLSFLREAVVFYGSLRASNNIHRLLLHNVMRAKLRFFDSTPLGRIMNRFSRDIEAIDQEVAPIALGMMHSLGSVIAIVVLISVITPGFLGAGVVITLLYCLIGTFYLRASRDLKRIESIQRSPLYQHFGETLSGVATIRAYGDERRFVRDNLQKIDKHNRPFFYLWACNRWLGFRVDIAGALVSFFAGVFVVTSIGRIDAGLAGLSLTYAITFTDNVLWVVRLYSTNEQNMNSVERVREYLNVDQEAPDIIPSNRPPATWPNKGAVTFDNYSTRYRADLDTVLKKVSFSIKPGEKVGIVGRTGAGKSSLALALFRGLEAETGSIIIDGIDIKAIGLKDLRQSITIVPQDATLFQGTIRNNLDPFGTYTDNEIFKVLRRVQLISSEPEGAAPVAGDDSVANKNVFLDLQSLVAESGNNLSQGQRQLLCLARALLKSHRVLLMDEATASLDYDTDRKIQSTIRGLHGTTFTIAHRLHTVANYDKVLVLEHGEVKEFAHPHELLARNDSMFYEMCESSGELEVLREMARKAYTGNRRLSDTNIAPATAM